jgi:hypothetical protein
VSRLATRCPGCDRAAIPLFAKLSAAVRSNVRCPGCGVSVGLSLWPRIIHLVLGELAVALGAVAAFGLETPVFLVLASASWFGFGLALPLSERTAGGAAGRRGRGKPTA